MNVSITVDWRFVFAIGGAVATVILADKSSSTAAESVLSNLVSTVKDRGVAMFSNH